MRDGKLVGVWSADALHSPGAQGDERLIFLPDGTGRYEVYNWVLCSSERFRWGTPELGVLRFTLDPPRPGSPWPAGGVPYSIDTEDTPVYGRIPVLRVWWESPPKERFGLVLADVTRLDGGECGPDG